jgi:hypothetical protein
MNDDFSDFDPCQRLASLAAGGAVASMDVRLPGWSHGESSLLSAGSAAARFEK